VAVAPDTPVSAIEGIGPAAERALEGTGVHTVADLLRATLGQLHNAVRALASLEEVRAWRQMALLLDVAAVTPQWAEALVHAEVFVDDLPHRSLSELLAMFAAARADGLIPNEPTPDQAAAMQRDAAVLGLTGSMSGVVQIEDGTPVKGAKLSIGTQTAESDALGRFRLLRIPLGRRPVLRVEHPDYAPLVVENPPLRRRFDALGSTTFTLADSVAASGPRLAEVWGDRLPTPSGVHIREHRVTLEELEPNDLLLVVELYTSAPDAKLSSRLKVWQDGEILVPTVRLPLAQLPAGVKLHDHFLWQNGSLHPVSVDRDGVRRYRARLRARKQLGNRTFPATQEGQTAFIDDYARLLAREGFFTGSARPRRT
jgi:hypothetical protein